MQFLSSNRPLRVPWKWNQENRRRQNTSWPSGWNWRRLERLGADAAAACWPRAPKLQLDIQSSSREATGRPEDHLTYRKLRLFSHFSGRFHLRGLLSKITASYCSCLPVQSSPVRPMTAKCLCKHICSANLFSSCCLHHSCCCFCSRRRQIEGAQQT